MEKEKLTGFMCYNTYLEVTDGMNDKQFREFIWAISKYVTDDVLPNFKEPIMNMIFKAIKGSIDNSKRRYLEKNSFNWR